MKQKQGSLYPYEMLNFLSPSCLSVNHEEVVK